MNLGNALTAELARGKGHMEGPFLSFAKRVWIAVGVMCIGLLLFAPQVLLLFGEGYRQAGTEILRILT